MNQMHNTLDSQFHLEVLCFFPKLVDIIKSINKLNNLIRANTGPGLWSIIR